MARRVLMVEISGVWVQVRPRLDWMDGVGYSLEQRDDRGGCSTNAKERKE